MSSPCPLVDSTNLVDNGVCRPFLISYTWSVQHFMEGHAKSGPISRLPLVTISDSSNLLRDVPVCQVLIIVTYLFTYILPLHSLNKMIFCNSSHIIWSWISSTWRTVLFSIQLGHSIWMDLTWWPITYQLELTISIRSFTQRYWPSISTIFSCLFSFYFFL